MKNLSSTVDRKYINTIKLEDWNIETDTGWEEVTHLHKTIPYQKWRIQTENGDYLECADDHIVFTENYEEIFVKDLIPEVSYIQTNIGPQRVLLVEAFDAEENMYDITVNSDNHRFYSNNILSHNSSMLDALTFSLFGKSFRGINKPQLVNSINEKDCLVEIEFTIGTINFKIRRGIKPNIFEIYRNDNLIDQNSSIIDQQKWFEQNILKMNYKSFTQIVILGSSNYVPFMQLSSANRREVIEDLLDIKIFSSMSNILKDKIKILKDDIRTLDLKKESLNDKVQMQFEFIEEIENRGKENIEKKKKLTSQLLQECDAYIFKNSEIEENVFSLNKELSLVSGSSDKLKKLGSLKGKFSQKVSSLSNENDFFKKNTVCPTCTQNIDESFRLNRIVETDSKLNELKSGFDELKKTIIDEELRELHFTKISKEITNLNHEISKNNTRVSGHQRQIQDLESEIQAITDQLKNRNIEREKLEKFNIDLKNVFDELNAKKELVGLHDFSYSLLKDSGVKTKIIKKYLPLINQQVNRYLQMMDFYVNFTLDEEFNESIQSPIHEDFSYASFSEGERARINLALMFAWREIAKLKNSVNCNILLFDEVFDSSLDGFGTDEFLKIIRYVIKDSNVFVITHKNGLEDKFGSVISFEKRKNFSYMI